METNDRFSLTSMDLNDRFGLTSIDLNDTFGLTSIDLNDRFGLTSVGNGEGIYTKCSECSNYICVGDDYYNIYGDNFCESCVRFLFHKVAGEDYKNVRK